MSVHDYGNLFSSFAFVERDPLSLLSHSMNTMNNYCYGLNFVTSFGLPNKTWDRTSTFINLVPQAPCIN